MHVSTAERPSADSSGFIISEIPFARDAINTALIVWDFDAGISTSPFSPDGSTKSFIEGIITEGR